jgi:hypothetical protein
MKPNSGLLHTIELERISVGGISADISPIGTLTGGRNGTGHER